MRLLPKDPHIGWTPYAWLIYLSGFLTEPFWRHFPPWKVAVSLAVTPVFLVLYFAGFWQLHRRDGWRLKAIAAAIVLLGVVCAPWNGGAVAFFIFGASFCGFMLPKRTALLSILAVVATVGAVYWVFRMPVWFGVIAGVFSLLIGGINVHYCEVRDAEAKLLASQAEVARLAKVAERERIARDLHDLLGHSLTLITLKAELAAKLVGRDPVRAAAEVAELERISRQTLREVRTALAGYRSDGLDAELARARLALESSGIDCEYFLVPLELGQAQESAIALALREAVTNVLRHSGARSCKITVDRGPDGVVLEVRDDGRGGEAPDGMGLSSMRQRIEGLGGAYQRSGEGGTTLRLTLPARAAPADRAPEGGAAGVPAPGVA